MLKPSLYNHFQPFGDDGYIAYNAYTGSVALMDKKNHAAYGRIVKKLTESTKPTFTDEEKALLTQLEFGGYVCRDEYDERAILKFRHNRDRYNTSALGLIIAPTLACNMACSYCYEGNKRGRMSPEIIDAILAFAEKRAPELSSIGVGWYGGEPLLAMDIIESLATPLREIASHHSLSYTSSAITNGYLLTRENADRLADLGVQNIQVTIDGPARVHDVKRPLKSGGSSFEQILANIAGACSLVAINVRVNIDKHCTDEMLEELLQELSSAGVRDAITLNFGHVAPYTDACVNIADSCYGTPEFSLAEARFYRMLFEKGFRIAKAPEPLTSFCMAQAVNSFVIDPRGELYRCSHHVGDIERSMGNIRDDIDYLNANFQRLFSFDPFDDVVCRECSLLPVCMGGCPAMRIDRQMSAEDVCRGWKYNLAPMLEVIALYRQQRITENQGEAEPVAVDADDAGDSQI